MTANDFDEIDDEVCAIMIKDGPDGHVDGHEVLTKMILRRIEQAVAAEREACAQTCQDLDLYQEDDPGESFAAAILMRATA